jgi:hypothetical protein
MTAREQPAWLPQRRDDWSRRSFLGIGLASLVGVSGPPALWAATTTAAHPLDEPLRLMAQARTSYQKVRDYICLVVKREQIKGRLSPNHVLLMKARTAPFSVYLRWQEPSDLKGQEACYVTGRHDGKIRVRAPGLLAAVGFVSIAPDDPRVLERSRHSITEAGIGNVIERLERGWQSERRADLTQVRLGVFEYNKRRCTRVETIHPTNPDRSFHYYRSVVYFDHEHHLPVRVECYDWPSSTPATGPGELVEVFSFLNVQLNVGLGDEVFRR